jgi:histidyl-tRNA synthetase
LPEKRQFRAIKGTRDILPPQSALWNSVEQTAREVFSTYGFGEIRTPIFEETGLFARSIGEDTDVVAKEMYSFTDRSETSISLRPEGTASVVRAYIEHKMHAWPPPIRLFYVGPMFRRERPQKGRFRQFYQIGAEVLGKGDEATIDSEVLEMLVRFFNRVGLLQTTLYINSIGDKNCRPQYIEALREHLRKPAVSERLGPDSLRRIETNPLRVLDSKLPEEQAVIEQLPRITNFLCDACRDQFELLKRGLDARGILFRENWRLVRGLDYYERTTFEITAGGLGAQNAVCGGGRYDGLVELLGGIPTPGFGFAVGTDRLILALTEQLDASVLEGQTILPNLSTAMQRPDVFVAGTTKETWDEAVRLAGSLRNNGLSVYLPKSGTKLQRVFETATKMETPVVMIVGESELKRGEYNVRVLKSLVEGEQRDVPIKTNDIILYGKIVKLRQDLERALARLSSASSELERQRSVSHAVERLTKMGVLPVSMAGAIRDVMPTLNKAIHGHDLAESSERWALAYGNLLLNELEKLTPFEDESLA